jgi:hypothetical protein
MIRAAVNRVLAALFLLFSCAMSTGHCAITEILCESLSANAAHCSVTLASGECGGCAGAAHAGHGTDCQLEKSFIAASEVGAAASLRILDDASSAGGKGGWEMVCCLCFACLCVAEKTACRLSLIRRRSGERLLSLARRWQFLSRAAGLARAPAFVVAA